ncbi:MAG: hypothetical protein FWF46_01920 [Oscillospiraceae bacterium]|nr:hypothetical protein [Oscillospiraceae bacterium]
MSGGTDYHGTNKKNSINPLTMVRAVPKDVYSEWIQRVPGVIGLSEKER